MTTTAELMECPFCGGKGVRGSHTVSDGTVLYNVRCRCGAGVNEFFYQDEADAAWNTRPKGGEAVADDALRSEWIVAGGSIHGPNVETVTMSEAEYFKFRRALYTQPPRANADEARDAAMAIARAYTAGFKEACEWPEPVVEDIDSPAFGSAQRKYVESAMAEAAEGEKKAP